MEDDMRKIATVPELRSLNAAYNSSAETAKERGQKLCYVTAVYPVELLRAMDIIPYYPENYGVVCVVRKMLPALSAAAQSLGCSDALCSYALCGIGSTVFEGENPMGGMPEPDLLLPCNAQCVTLVKWFQLAASRLGISCIPLDTPFVRGPVILDAVRDYVVSQLYELIYALEEMTGNSFDIDRLREVLSLSARACALWNEVLDMAAAKPSPWSAFDEYIHMAPIVTLRGTQECVDYYEHLRAFLMRRKEAAYAAVPGEKYRFYWDNIPMWFRLREQSELLSSYGIVLLASLYTHSWTYSFDSSDPLRSLADNYTGVFCNRDINYRKNLVLELMRRYSVNGYIFHSNRSCKPASFGAYAIMEELLKDTGISGFAFDADMGDDKLFQESKFVAQLEQYLEILDARNTTEPMS